MKTRVNKRRFARRIAWDLKSLLEVVKVDWRFEWYETRNRIEIYKDCLKVRVSISEIGTKMGEIA